MSIFVSGMIYCKETGGSCEVRERLSFPIQRAALDCGFGIVFEEHWMMNVAKKYRHGMNDNRLFYKIQDSPMIPNSEEMFSTNIWSNDGRQIVNEPVESRMRRVERFLRTVLELPEVEKIFFELDSFCGPVGVELCETIDLPVGEFARYMTARYEEQVLEPDVRLNLTLEGKDCP